MLSTERNEYTSNELARGAHFMREGMMFAVRRLNVEKGRLLLGNPNANFTEEFIQGLVTLCMRFTLLNDPEVLSTAIIREGTIRPTNYEGDNRFFPSLWLASAKDVIRNEREGATPLTDLALGVSISRVSDCLEEFALARQFNEQKFTKVPAAILIDEQPVQPISTCPAIRIVRGWSEAYTTAREAIAVTHPNLIP
jgi:hypothetical protein